MDRLEKIFYDELRYNSIDSKEDILNAMKTAYNQAIEDAIRNCEILRCPWDKVNDGGINPDSILKLKIK